MLKIFRWLNTELGKLAIIDIRFLLLICLLFTLPSLEALKNIFAFSFVLSWLFIAKKNNDWGGKWIVIDTIFLLWILADIFVSINAVISYQLPGDNFRDILRFVLIGWVLSRIYFSKERLVQSAVAVIVATLITLLFSYVTAHGEFKELHSVGHINHSAIYLVITYSISLALLIFNFKNLNTYQKVTLIFSCVVFSLTIANSGSRAALGLLLIITLIDIIYLFLKLKKLSLLIGFFTLTIFIGVFSSGHPRYTVETIEKSVISHLEHFFYDENRKMIREFSYYAFRTNPIFGIGFGNFGLLNESDIKTAVIRDKKEFDTDFFMSSPHTHNVYYNYLVSGGILLFSIFVWFWIYIFWIIAKLLVLNSFIKFKSKYPENEWILLSAISSVLITLGIGLVNTTLHHEHAILTMYVLGILIAQIRKCDKNDELTI